jgi:Tfp pilus assembly major pilin PilA
MKLIKKVLGVTLLEVMLVLAIAAMIIVMSVRYYQSATSSSQSNTALTQIQSIIVAADSISQAGGTYTGVVTSSAISPLLPSNGLVMPWGETATIGTGTSGSVSTLTIGLTSIPTGVCPILFANLKANNHITISPTACTSGAVTAATITYNPAPSLSTTTSS